MKTAVLFIDSNHPILHETLEKAGIQCDLNYHWTESEIAANIHLYDGIVIRSRICLGKELIDKGTKLHFIARAGAGMENIDVVYAEGKGIRCLHSPEGNKDAVAEHAAGMLLALFNNLCRANAEVREERWVREGNRGLELMGKTVGIIGYGNTGMAFAQRLKGFDVQVLAVDKYKKGFTDEYALESSLEEVFSKADVVSLHLPLNPETQYYANAAFLQQFKKPFFLLNTSRGKVLNTADLVEALKTKRILGACLDVLEYETLSFEKLDQDKLPEAFRYLCQASNVMLSPHIAGWTVESNVKIAGVLAEKIIRLCNS
jgi:D-3-phosphoglycerate dehydrogenase